MRKHVRAGGRACALHVAAFTALAQPTLGQAITAVAVTGTQAPGCAPGVMFQTIEAPTINASGEIALRAQLMGPGVNASNEWGIWKGSAGAFGLFARAGDALPPLAGTGLWSGFGVPSLADTGDVMVVGGNDDVIGVYLGSAGAGLQVVADTGQHMPVDRPAGTVARWDSTGRSAELSRSGFVGLRMRLKGGAHDGATGMWAGGPGALNLMALTQTPAGITPPLEWHEFGRFRVNALGETAFWGRSDEVVSVGGYTHFDQGVFIATPGEVRAVARVGQPAPGMPPGTLLGGEFSHKVALSNSGEAAFRGVFRGAPGSPVEGHAIWAGVDQNLRLVARRGQAAPGTPGTFLDLNDNFSIAASGRVVFGAYLDGVPTNERYGLWCADPAGEMDLVAQSGTPFPDLESDIIWGGFSDPFINDTGDIAFFATYRRFGHTVNLGEAIFGRTADGQLIRVVKTGDMLDVGGGILREVLSLSLLPGVLHDDPRLCINDAGQIAFWARFVDGSSGAFVGVVPAPGGAVSLLALVALGVRRTGRRDRRTRGPGSAVASGERHTAQGYGRCPHGRRGGRR